MRPRRLSLTMIGALLVFAFATTTARADERVAQLSKVDGSVQITRAADGTIDQAQQIGPRVRNGSVFPGDVVSTDPGSTATLVFSDGSQIDLKQKTSLSVRETDLAKLVEAGKSQKPIGRTIKVLAGDIWTHVVPNPQVATEFETPSGVAAVKGTTFTISVDSGGEEGQP